MILINWITKLIDDWIDNLECMGCGSKDCKRKNRGGWHAPPSDKPMGKPPTDRVHVTNP